MYTISYQNALARAAALCSRSEKCVSDVRTKLFQWKLAPEEHDKLIAYLIDQKYIDEVRYAHSFVRDKFRFNKWGKVKIRYHLLGKGVCEGIVQTAIDDEIDESEYKKLAQSLIQSKLRALKSGEPFEIRGKILQYLSGRGFELEIIHKALDSVDTK